MRRILLVLALGGLAGSTSARGDGLFMPVDRSLPPLSLTYQRVNVTIDEQVATTSVEQVYRNNTGQDLEADYLFPLPAGASVRQFAMWVGGKRLTGETVEAAKARSTYEDIVRRLKDPGLLEYVGCDLWKVRIYPVPRDGEQKIEIKFTTLLKRDGSMVNYSYPLKTGQTPRTTTGDFTIRVELKSPDALGPIYSPSHDVAVNRDGDRRATVSFERNKYTLDKDFSLYFAPKSKDVGLSLLTQRESSGSPGYFLLLLSPRVEGDEPTVPRDLVVVLDTSSSMSAEKIQQAKGALKYALDSLKPDDRFALIQFATVVTPFRDGLLKATPDDLRAARAWVEKLEAQGATDIHSALEEALKLREPGAGGRTFQLLFLTDGLPTVGVTDPKAILKAVQDRTGGGTRIFTFGVGDDVNAHLLDQMAEDSRAASTYVRPGEDLEVKASALMAKIRYPVRTELKLKVGEGVRLTEIYPPKLSDLFRGEQLQVAGRFEGQGHVALTLDGRVGDRDVSESYDTDFPALATDHDFIAPIWARRKVGYLLDQIRLNGESPEVRDEVIRLAREFGIATPYTSLLIVPDDAPALNRLTDNFGRPLMRGGFGGRGASEMTANGGARRPEAQAPSSRPGARPQSNETFELRAGRGDKLDGVEEPRDLDEKKESLIGRAKQAKPDSATPAKTPALGEEAKRAFEAAKPNGKAAIDLAEELASLKKGEGRADEGQAVQSAAGQKFRKVADVWVDERFDPKAPALKLQFLGKAYFRLLERHPELKSVLALGDRVVWVAPSGMTLVIDNQGEGEVPDATLDALFAPAKTP